MERILDKAAKASEQAEVFSVSSRSTEALFEANRLKQAQTKESAGRSLRLVRNGRIGFAATTKIGGEEQLVEMALEMAPFGAVARFELPGPQSYPAVNVFDAAVGSMQPETMVQLGQSLIDRVRAAEPDILCEGSVRCHSAEVRIMNSRGGSAAYEKTVCSVSIEGTLIRGTDMLFVGDYESSCHPLESADRLAASVLQQLERARETAAISAGNLPVIFTPHGVASALLSPLVVAFNGKTVLRGASPLGHRKGEQVLAPEITLINDGTVDFSPAAALCDDEGVPSRRTPLFENGVVMNFLYDLQTAGEAGTVSTGSASRSVGNLPNPSPQALILTEGEVRFEDLVADIKTGLVIEQVMGATQGNILGGDFSGNVLLGYKVENGRIVGRVKNTMISGNVYQLLKDGVVLGAESRWLGGSLKTPSVFCASVAVAAT